MKEEKASNKLSEEDMAVLHAFDAMDDWPVQTPSSTAATPHLMEQPVSYAALQEPIEVSAEDMLLIFVTEVSEDVAAMRHTLNQLNQLEHETHVQLTYFAVFRRLGHKVRGSAGIMEYHSIVRIAEHIEELAEQTVQGSICPPIAVKTFDLAVSALEAALQGVVTSGKESSVPLVRLEEELKNLSVHEEDKVCIETIDQQAGPEIVESSPALAGMPLNTSLANSYMPIDINRFTHLLKHSEQLAELRTPLESALVQVESALQELHIAQSHLAQLEPMHFALRTTSQLPPLIEELPTSSLIARILSNAGQKGDTSHHSYKSKAHTHPFKPPVSSMWDEMDIEHYTEQDLLLNSLREAVSLVNAASSRVRVAFTHLHLVIHEYTAQATAVRNDTLELRLVPLSALVPHLREMLATSTSAVGQHIQLEVVGDATEIDQPILEALSIPLLQLLQACCVDASLTHMSVPSRIWLHAQEIGNEVAIEVGFSLTVSSGAIEPLREVIQRLNGALSLQRNITGGVSFHLRLPRSQGAIHCLLVRVNDQHVIVPFSQVQRIGDSQREQFDQLYSFHDLLGFSPNATMQTRIQPVLMLLKGASPVSVGITVDQVVDEVELAVKPLASYLQRPGITSAAIDGRGHVLLMTDLPELVRHYAQVQHNTSKERNNGLEIAQPTRRTPAKILLADDSVALRNTLALILKHAHYVVLEARDGLEALEQLVQHVPDVFLLDVEMPNLNGYDLLGIMRLYPSLAGIKIIMLTSRSSEKHIQHAMEMGAHAYLTKPCPPETLIETIQKLLRNQS